MYKFKLFFITQQNISVHNMGSPLKISKSVEKKILSMLLRQSLYTSTTTLCYFPPGAVCYIRHSHAWFHLWGEVVISPHANPAPACTRLSSVSPCESFLSQSNLHDQLIAFQGAIQHQFSVLADSLLTQKSHPAAALSLTSGTAEAAATSKPSPDSAKTLSLPAWLNFLPQGEKSGCLRWTSCQKIETQCLNPKRLFWGLSALRILLTAVGSALAARLGSSEPEEKVTALWSLVRAGVGRNPHRVPKDRVVRLYKQDSGVFEPPVWPASIPVSQRIME